MKIVYLNESQINEIKEQVTFFSFQNNVIVFLKALLNDPINAQVTNFFRNNGINKSSLLKMLLKKNIIEKKEKITEIDGKSVYSVQYKIPKRNFRLKLKRLYQSYFENNRTVDGLDSIDKQGLTATENINETDCAGVGAVGNGSDSSGQFLAPLTTKIIRKKIKTNE